MEVYAAGAKQPWSGNGQISNCWTYLLYYRSCSSRPRPVTYRHVIDGLWYPNRYQKLPPANRWYRDTFGGDYDELSEAVAQIERGSNGLFFHPYLQGEITPYLNDKLRASFVGATSHHTKAHFNRAVLEGIAFSMKDCYHTLECLDIAPKEAVLIGGGAKAPLWRQIMADMLNIPLRTVEDVDSSLGSAMLAGVACGVFTSHQEAAEKCIRLKDEIHPSSEGVAFYMEQFAVYKEIQAVLAPIYQKL